MYVEYGVAQKDFEIDLGAEKLVAAEKGNRRIAVEIKEFSNSVGNEFHTALGQFLDYKAALSENAKENDRTLYIALPDEIYIYIASVPFFVRRIEQYGLRFILIVSF